MSQQRSTSASLRRRASSAAHLPSPQALRSVLLCLSLVEGNQSSFRQRKSTPLLCPTARLHRPLRKPVISLQSRRSRPRTLPVVLVLLSQQVLSGLLPWLEPPLVQLSAPLAMMTMMMTPVLVQVLASAP